MPELTPQEFVSKWKRVNACERIALAWKSDLGDEEILAKLLSLNLERGK